MITLDNAAAPRQCPRHSLRLFASGQQPSLSTDIQWTQSSSDRTEWRHECAAAVDIKGDTEHLTMQPLNDVASLICGGASIVQSHSARIPI
jgi:hypothetical protein